MENEKIRQDYQLLRNSIKRGVEQQELESQYVTLQEELKRRGEECIQLRAVLSHQSQSIRSLGQTNSKNDMMMRVHDEGELLEAFQAQKLVNRQLEAELTALTQEQTAKLTDLNKMIDDLRDERNKLQTIMQEQVEATLNDDENGKVSKVTENYLRYELQKSSMAYVELQVRLLHSHF